MPKLKTHRGAAKWFKLTKPNGAGAVIKPANSCTCATCTTRSAPGVPTATPGPPSRCSGTL